MPYLLERSCLHTTSSASACPVWENAASVLKMSSMQPTGDVYYFNVKLHCVLCIQNVAENKEKVISTGRMSFDGAQG